MSRIPDNDVFRSNLNIYKTGDKRPSGFASLEPAMLSCDVTKLAPEELTRSQPSPLQDCYRMYARIGVEFWANSAEYEQAKARAEKLVMQRIYGDTIFWLREAVSAIYDHDRQRAIEILLQLEKNIAP